MATKKAQSKAAPASDNSAMWKWVYVIGVLVAGVAAAAAIQNDILTWVLIAIGVLVGIFFFDSDDVQNFGLRYLIIGAVALAAPFASVPVVGAYIDAFVAGFATFLGPIVLTLAVRYFWKKYFGSM